MKPPFRALILSAVLFLAAAGSARAVVDLGYDPNVFKEADELEARLDGRGSLNDPFSDDYVPPPDTRKMTEADWERMRQTMNVPPEMERATAQDFAEQDRANKAERERLGREKGAKLEGELATARKRLDAKAAQKPTAQELEQMMQKLSQDDIPASEKKRLTAVIFAHQDVYRDAARQGKVPHDSPQVQAFLEHKKGLQEEAISRMGKEHEKKFGEPMKETVIPFGYNNIYSDDDLVTGTGEAGRKAETAYADSLNEVIKEQTGRPMDEHDRKRVDVNGLAWNMTEEGAHADFDHPEKYINPQSGYANKQKLLQDAEAGKITGKKLDAKGRLVNMTREETVEAIKKLKVDDPLPIPGIDPEKGSGSMSDYLRMADKHKIQPKGAATPAEVAQFTRNQKYTKRPTGDYKGVYGDDATLLDKHAKFFETSDKLAGAMTDLETARILEEAYGIKTLTRAGTVDYDKLAEAMLHHQNLQLGTVLPEMLGAVTKTEAYKIVEWLKNAGKGSRELLRRKMALTYAPLADDAIAKIVADIDSMPIDEADKTFLKNVVQNDAKQIRRYAAILKMDPAELAAGIELQGDSRGLVAKISRSATVKPLTGAFAKRKGGSKFQEFLETKTAKALNLDSMLSPEAARSEKFMSWGMMLWTAARHYNAAPDRAEGLRSMGLAMFETIPFVASALRFSEMEGREAFKELAMDLYPPLALANIAVTTLNYTAQTAITAFTESKWDQLAESVLNEMTDDDFVESDIKGFWRLKNREQLLEYLDEVSPGLGKIAKLSSLIEPEIDARMSRHPEAQTNAQALHTLRWFEPVDADAVTQRYRKSFDLEQLRARVYEKGVPAASAASPVERVAARILMDDLRIRKELYYEVLNSFMDRIEKLYNERKGKKDDGYGAIAGRALQALKEIYENAPQKIKDSPWGAQQLEEEYRRNVEFLTKYKPVPEDKPDIEIEREMAELLDAFRAFIKKLAVAVDIEEESRYIDLRAYAYGGDKSMEPTDHILLGDTFRLGVSARVSPRRAGQKWTVYYYGLDFEAGKFGLIGSVKLDAKKFASGGEGRWVIEAPEKATFLEVSKEKLDAFFRSDERMYRVRPVIAFGEWPADPVSAAGIEALKSPIDHPELFSEDKAAFVGEPAEFAVFRARLYLDAPQWIYRDDKAAAKAAIRLAPYAADTAVDGSFSALAYKQDAKEMRIRPERHSRLAVDHYEPPKNVSESRLEFDKDADGSSYELTLTAKVRGLDDAYQPKPVSVTVQYVNEDNPKTRAQKEETGIGAAEDAAAAAVPAADTGAMDALLAEAEGARGQAVGALGALKADAAAVRSEEEALKAEIRGLSSLIAEIDALTGARPAVNLPHILEQIRSQSQEYIGLKGTLAATTLSVCEYYETIKGAGQGQASQIHLAARTQYQHVQSLSARAASLEQSLAGLRNQAEAAGGSGVAELKNKQDTLRQRLAKMDGAAGSFKARVEAKAAAADPIAGPAAQTAGVVGRAAEVLKADGSAPNQKKFGQIQAIHGQVGQMASEAASVRSAFAASGAAVEGERAGVKARAEQALAASAAAVDQETMAQIRSTHDAAMVFRESIQDNTKNAGVCWGGVQRAASAAAGSGSADDVIKMAKAQAAIRACNFQEVKRLMAEITDPQMKNTLTAQNQARMDGLQTGHGLYNEAMAHYNAGRLEQALAGMQASYNAVDAVCVQVRDNVAKQYQQIQQAISERNSREEELARQRDQERWREEEYQRQLDEQRYQEDQWRRQQEQQQSMQAFGQLMQGMSQVIQQQQGGGGGGYGYPQGAQFQNQSVCNAAVQRLQEIASSGRRDQQSMMLARDAHDQAHRVGCSDSRIGSLYRQITGGGGGGTGGYGQVEVLTQANSPVYSDCPNGRVSIMGFCPE